MSRLRHATRRTAGAILVVLLILAGVGTTAGFEKTLLVVPSYQLVEEAHSVHVTYVSATGVYTLRYEAHNVMRIWGPDSGKPDEIERTIAERSVTFVDLSPFGVGVHTIPSKLLRSQPAVYESIVVGDAGTLPADGLPPVDPTGPGLTAADEQDDIVAGAPATLVSYEYLALRGAEDEAAAEAAGAAAGVDESTNVGNEEASGDPVLVASGMFTTSEIDLALSAGAVSIVVERVHRSDLGLAGSLGSAWWLSLDTRIVLGESRRAADVQAVASANAASILTADVASLAAIYAASRAVITGPMGVARARLREARRTYDALARFKLTYDGAYRTVVIREIDRQLLIAGRLVAQGQAVVDQFATHLSNLDAAYGTTSTGALGALYAAAAEHQAVAETYGLHADRAESHAARNGRFGPGVSGSVAENARAAGNDSVTLIDTDGIPRRFSYLSAADMESERTYSDGSTNYYPSGTHLASEKPTEDTLRLTPEGEFVLTRKDGSCWIYGVCGQLLRIEDRNGNRAAFHYNAEEQLHQITDSRGREVRLDRSPIGLLTEIHAPEETRIFYAYDAAEQLGAVTDSAGDTVRYEYDGTRITRITKPDGSFREYGYEYVRGALRATTTTDEEGKAETFDFTSPDRTVHTNPSGVQTVHHFNADRRVSRIDHESGAEHPGGLSELFAYNSTGDRIYRRATDGTEYRYAYDDRHNLLRVDYPDGTAEAWTYNSFDLPETHIDRRDQLTDYHYDGRGNLTRVDYPDRTADVFTYEPPGVPAAGEVATHTDRRGNVRTYTYDPLGFLKSISDTIGPVARHEHGALGRVTIHEDGLGSRTTYTYTLDGRLDTVVGPEGLLIDHDYDERKDLVRLVANGRMTTFRYDDRHLLTLATNALGQTVSYDYRDDGRPRRRTLRNADGTERSITEFQYNDGGLLRREVQTDIGAVTEYEYDAAGRVAAVTDAEGSRTEYRHSFDGRLVGRTRYLDGRSIEETFQYYPRGPMRQAVDPLDRTTSWEHDPTLRTLTRVDPFWNRSRSTLDPYDLVLSETDPTGRSKFYDYDKRGRLIAVRNDLSTLAEYGYDFADRLISFTDGENNTWRYEYDSRGRLVAVTHPDGATRHIQYNLDDTIASETDETGLETTYEYDPLGRKIARIDPGVSDADPASGRRTKYTWNYLGVLESVTDPTGRTTSYRGDPAGRVTGSWDNTGALIAYERDFLGAVTAVIDPTGRRTDYVYDALHRLTSIRQAGEQTVRYGYDDAGNIRYEYDGADQPHEYIYDDLDRLETEINRLAAKKHYTYDDAGRPTTITDYTGITAEFDYDAAGLLTGVAYSDGTFLGYRYDDAGRMIMTENQHERLEFEYTPRGLLGFVAAGTRLRYDHDAAGRRTALEDLTTGCRTEYLYDDRGFLAGLHDSFAGFTSFDYDDAGRRTEIAVPNGVVTSTTHDAAGRIAATVVTNASLADPVIDGLAHVYDEAGRRLYDVDHHGAITGYEYDAQGRLSQVQYPFSGPKRLSDYGSFEEFGVVAPVPSGQTLGEEFDPGPADAQPGGTPYQSYLSLSPGAVDLIEQAHRLIYPLRKGGVLTSQQVWTEAFDYDDAGNRAAWRTGWGEVGYTYDPAGRLERAAGAVYDYDVAGNLTSATTTGTTHYTYNVRNRLAFVATPDATIAYTYDPLGRRLHRTSATAATADLTKTPSTAVHRTTYQYDGLSFAVTAREEADYPGGGDLSSLAKSPASDGERYRPAPGAALPLGVSALSRFVYHEATVPREPMARTLSVSGPSGTTYLSHDVLGSVRVSTGATGIADAAYQYDAFGSMLTGRIDPVQLDPSQPYGYNGKPQDPATGLSNYGFRDYLPAIGRFITPDPVKDGTNWYAYVNNDPMNRVDPWGLAPRNLTETERANYKEHVAGFTETTATLPAYESGPREDQDWDCADLATYIASGAMDSANGGTNFYRNLTADGTALTSIPSIHSSDFAEDGNVTFYRTADGSIDNAFSSKNVEAGTIGVFSNHIITVTADRASTSDAILTIQGHSTRDATRPDIGSQSVLDEYRGTFIGWAEIGPRSTRPATNAAQGDDSGIKNR